MVALDAGAQSELLSILRIRRSMFGASNQGLGDAHVTGICSDLDLRRLARMKGEVELSSDS